MSDPEFSAQKFREILLERVQGRNKGAGMRGYPGVYWMFYTEGKSPIVSLFEPEILRMSNEEIMEAYAKWRIES